MYTPKSDNLEFNEPQLEAQIEILEGIREMLTKLKNQYVDYVESQLRPNWTTDSGVKSVESLEKFANINIQEFINYFDQKINDLRAALQNVKNINMA